MQNRHVWYSRLWRPAFFVACIGVATKVFQALAGVLLAWRVGAGGQTDAYMLAKSIPIGLYLIVDSLLYNSLVPLLRRHRHAPDFFNAFALGALTLSTLGSILIALFAPAWIALLGPGLQGSTRQLAIILLRIAAPSVILAAMASLLKALNAAQGRYLLASLDGFFLSGLLVLVLSGNLSGNVLLLIAVLPMAFLLLLALQYSAARRDLAWAAPAFGASHWRETILLLLPLTGINVLQQLNLWVMNGIVSLGEAGGISCLNYSYSIAQIPVGVVDLVLFSTIFPLSAALAAADDHAALQRVFNEVTRLLLWLTLPLLGWLLLERNALVSLILQRGRFDSIDHARVVWILCGYALALPFWTLEALGCRTLFALQQPGGYFKILTLRVLLNAGLAVVLYHCIGELGVSMAFAIAHAFGAIRTLRSVRVQLGAATGTQNMNYFQAFAAISATFLGGLAVYLLRCLGCTGTDWHSIVLRSVASGGVVLAVYFLGTRYASRYREQHKNT